MKIVILIIGIISSFESFSQSLKPPASIQKISNATLTCPTGKWCKVLAHVSLTPRFANLVVTDFYGGRDSSIHGSTAVSSVNENFELIIRSGDTLACTASTVSSSVMTNSVTFTFNPYITCSVSSTQIFKGIASLLFPTGSTASSYNYNQVIGVISDYSFYSMEYFN